MFGRSNASCGVEEGKLGVRVMFGVLTWLYLDLYDILESTAAYAVLIDLYQVFFIGVFLAYEN
jgi:hypothetical protein